MICFPTRPPINPLRLASNYRDYYGDPDAILTALTDPVDDAGCYVPRIFHAPDTATENLGLAANGTLDYALALPPGAFILGFLHTFTSAASADTEDPPVGSGFTFNVTDIALSYPFFEKPVPETWLLNDAPSFNPQSVLAGPPALWVQNPSVRLLPSPYPVTDPGIFRVDFYNTLADANNLIRLSLLVAVPDLDKLSRSTANG